MYLRSRLNLMACSKTEIFTTAIFFFVFLTVAEEIACCGTFDLQIVLKRTPASLQCVCNVD